MTVMPYLSCNKARNPNGDLFVGQALENGGGESLWMCTIRDGCVQPTLQGDYHFRIRKAILQRKIFKRLRKILPFFSLFRQRDTKERTRCDHTFQVTQN